MLLVSRWFFFEPKMLLVSRKNEKTELSGPSWPLSGGIMSLDHTQVGVDPS